MSWLTLTQWTSRSSGDCMEKTSVQFERDDIDALDDIAKLEEMNRSQVIRKACKQYIKSYRDKGEIK